MDTASVTHERMRHAIHATDPINTSLRWRGNLSCRRPYSVPGPNLSCHIVASLQKLAMLTPGSN